MRASRLLRILLILQNRGRVSTLQLARELEVARRTVMRDLEALEEAGLPIVTHRGHAGGVELGFNYRARFVGLDAEEAEALGVILGVPNAVLDELGMRAAALRAADKLVESLPTAARVRVRSAQKRFQFVAAPASAPDPRVMALVDAVRRSLIVRLRARTVRPRVIHPIAMRLSSHGWELLDARDSSTPVPQREWGDINISAVRFAQ